MLACYIAADSMADPRSSKLPQNKDDDSKRSYRDILVHELVEGLAELRRPKAGLLLSGLSAGLDVGFSVFLMAVAVTLAQGELSPLALRALLANLYAVGFILVIVGRSELFTEHTTLAVFPVLNRNASIARLLRLWALVYSANVIGALAFAFVMPLVGSEMGILEEAALREIALPMFEHPGWVIFLGAVLAGWLMGLLSWLVAAARETISQILIVWLVTSSIGFLHLQHCIVGTVEVAAAMFWLPDVTFVDFMRFLVWATLGNVLGGVFFVALIKYSHAIQSIDIDPEREQLELESKDESSA